MRNPANNRDAKVSVLFTKISIPATKNPSTPVKKTIFKYQLVNDSMLAIADDQAQICISANT
jgi:hypothetical protein